MREAITVEEYCKAFETWARVCLESEQIEEDVHQVVLDGCTHLREMFEDFDGTLEIDALCDALTDWYKRQTKGSRSLSINVSKSCLLDRLIYAGEPLRTKKCPKHNGHWSGWSFRDDCPHGCNFGPNITGWIP